MSIPMMAEREEALRLWEAENAAEDALNAAMAAAYEAKPDVVAKYDELESGLDEQEHDDQDAADAAYDALLVERMAALGLAELWTALEAARKALLEGGHGVIAMWRGGTYAAARCAKTNTPLLVSDETVCDDETGEVWLRSALGLPPRPVKVEKEEIEEAA